MCPSCWNTAVCDVYGVAAAPETNRNTQTTQNRRQGRGRTDGDRQARPAHKVTLGEHKVTLGEHKVTLGAHKVTLAEPTEKMQNGL